jgi:hypothetical protein
VEICKVLDRVISQMTVRGLVHTFRREIRKRVQGESKRREKEEEKEGEV